MIPETTKDAIRAAYNRLSGSMPGFRRRQQQMRMIADITRVLHEKSSNPQTREPDVALVNGPTGTGKTFSYLLPAVIIAKEQKVKLVLSTATVALQEQLINRDIPDLARYAGLELKAALAKGRGRYVCLVRLHHAAGTMSQADMLADAVWERPPAKSEIKALIHLAESYGKGRWNGDRDTLKDPLEDGLWARVTNDTHGCARRKCPEYRNCAYYKARNEVFAAEIIVANHDLVMTSCESEMGGIVPKPEAAIMVFDEAHHLPDIAISRASSGFSFAGAVSWLAKMPAALSSIARRLKADVEAEIVKEEAGVLSGMLALAKRDLEETYAGARQLPMGGTFTFPKGELPQTLAAQLEQIEPTAVKLRDTLEALYGRLADAMGNAGALNEAELIAKEAADLGFYTGRMMNLCETLEIARKTSDEAGLPIAKWLTRHEKTGDIGLNASPVQAAGILQRLLWGNNRGIVLTSATLTSLGNFEFFKKSAGLSGNVIECNLASPFRHGEQGVLDIPKMKSDPANAAEHTAEVAELTRRIVEETTTGTLVLCTSKKQMKEVHDALPELLRERVLVQGTLSKAELIKTHKERVDAGQPSVIFGLQSFGEGVDLPHHYCEHVVVAKLPFAPPDSPIEKVLSEWMEEQGRNPFMEITLPKACLKLIQWTGRLIRSEEDTGRVTIMDRRLRTKRYGEQLIAALPPFART